MLNRVAFVLTAGALLALSSPSKSMPVPRFGDGSSVLVRIADGCGPGRYRGPGGACHPFGRGPYPDGYWGTATPALPTGMAVRPATGAVPGATAGTRPITAGCPAAAGNSTATSPTKGAPCEPPLAQGSAAETEFRRRRLALCASTASTIINWVKRVGFL